MDSVQISFNFVVLLLLGIGTLAGYVVFDAGTPFLFMGCVLLLSGGLGHLADRQNASRRVRTAINVLGVIGLGVALLWITVAGDVFVPGALILAGTLIVLALLMPTDYFSGPVAWSGMAVGSTVAAAAEMWIGSLFGAAIFAGMAMMFVGMTIRYRRRSTPKSSPE